MVHVSPLLHYIIINPMLLACKVLAFLAKWLTVQTTKHLPVGTVRLSVTGVGFWYMRQLSSCLVEGGWAQIFSYAFILTYLCKMFFFP